MQRAQRLHVAPVLQCGKDECHHTDTNHQQRILAWSKYAVVPDGVLFLEILEKLVDRESETDQRRRGPDPRHQRAIVGQPGPVRRQHCRSVRAHD